MSEILQILDRGYTLIWREDRLEDALSGLDDDFEWVVPDHPEGAVRHGSASVIEFFREWLEPWDDLRVDWEIEEVAPGRGLASIDMSGRGHGSGAPTEMRIFQLWTFRDGRAVRMELFRDADEARRAASSE
jgi:ketosteroid isomerase-like protein